MQKKIAEAVKEYLTQTQPISLLCCVALVFESTRAPSPDRYLWVGDLYVVVAGVPFVLHHDGVKEPIKSELTGVEL